jgi:hypothetical protein
MREKLLAAPRFFSRSADSPIFSQQTLSYGHLAATLDTKSFIHEHFWGGEIYLNQITIIVLKQHNLYIL